MRHMKYDLYNITFDLKPNDNYFGECHTECKNRVDCIQYYYSVDTSPEITDKSFYQRTLPNPAYGCIHRFFPSFFYIMRGTFGAKIRVINIM